MIGPRKQIRKKDRRRGQSMLEFVLGFLAFFFLTMGLFEFGRATWAGFT